MAGSRERTFLTELKQSADSYGYWYHKIPDSILSNYGRFNPVKRFDLYLASGDMVVAAEAKATNTRYAFDQMRESEEHWLQEWSRATNLPALVILNFRQKSPRVNRAFWIEIGGYETQRKVVLPERKSLNLAMVEGCWREIPRKKRYGKTVWDLSRIIKFFTKDPQEE